MNEVRRCRDCALRKNAKRPVPGVGPQTARVVIVGQAPGWEEDREGLPWVGQAGQFLSAALDVAGVTGVYLTNLVKCYPGRQRGGDAEPPPYAVRACAKHLQEELETIKPKLVVAVGAVAMRYFGIKGGINQNSGRAFDTPWGRVLPILHPAGLMRRPASTPIFTTQIHAITTHLSPPPPPPGPLFQFTPDQVGCFGLDVETEDNKIWCAGIAINSQKTAYRWHQKGDGLTAILAEAGAVPVMHHAKYDLSYFDKEGIVFKDWHDTLLQAALLGYQPKGLKKLAPVFLGVGLRDYKEVVGKGRLADVESEALEYCSLDAWSTLKLHELFYPQLQERGLLPLYEKEKRFTRLLMQMESIGLPVDQAKLRHGKRLVLQKLGALETKLAGYGLDEPGNTERVGQKFWRGKTRVKTTKTGELSTSALDLREHALPHEQEWVKAFIEWRSASYFLRTYLLKWEGHERLYPSFNQTGTVTGRLSTSDPNLMNVAKSKVIPLLQLFVAPEDWTFISADYSQGELRVLANISGDENMIAAYLAGRDLHTETTNRIAETGLFDRYGINHPDDQRRFAKTINFGVVYDITDYGLAPRLGLKQGQAQPFIDGFYASNPRVRPWQREQVTHAEQHGYVLTHAGRPVYVPCVLAERGILRTHGEKQCTNYPVQGGLAEIVKDAMLRAPKYLCLQVHDELLYLVPKSEAEEYAQFLAETLVDHRHAVPYTVDIHTGDTWGDIKNIEDVWEEEEDEPMV